MRTALALMGIGTAMIGAAFLTAYCVDQVEEQREFAKAYEPAPPKPSTAREGSSTWYARGLQNPDGFTAASRHWPRGTRLVVEHDCKTVIVTVRDFGPEEATGHVLDLSRGAFRALAPLEVGIIPVRVAVAQ